MKKYPKYKPSEIDWIGEIPEHWEMIKIKYLLSSLESGNRESGGGSQLKEGVFSLGGEHIDWRGKLLLSSSKFISEEYYETLKKGKILKNDILLVKDGATIGKCAHLSEKPFEKCAVNEHVFILRTHKNYNSKYIYYFIVSTFGQEQIKLEIRGAAQGGLTSNFINILLLPISDISEQTTIANFLDRKTAEIDDLISKKQKMIDLLNEEKTAVINHAVTKGIDPNIKMKDSGIPWLGDIPEHWEVKKIKHISSIISKGTTPSTLGKSFINNGLIKFIKAENIVDNKLVSNPENYIDEETNELLKRSKLKLNDILFVIAGATIGKIAIVTENFLPSNTNQAISFIRVKNIIFYEFVYYWLQTHFIQKIMWLCAVQSAQPNLSMENLGNFTILFPQIEEQKKIVDYINDKITNINSIIEKEQKQIDLLNEYRTALINEAVTGKIDVRNL